MTARLDRPATAPRRLLVLALALAALVVPLAPTPAHAQSDPGAEGQFVQLLNQERTSRGLAPLAVAGDLVDVARRHAVRMADQNDLHHNPNLASEVSGWDKLGENVGRGPSVPGLHRAFMQSEGHRANILDPEFTQLGIGVEVRDGTIWVTEVFRTPSGQPAPQPAAEPEPAPAPAPEPAPAPAPQTAPAPAAAPAPAPSAAAPAPDPVPAPEAAPALTRTLDRGTVVFTRVAAEESGARPGELLAELVG